MNPQSHFIQHSRLNISVCRMSSRPIITPSQLRTRGQTQPIATSASVAQTQRTDTVVVARGNLYALALQRVPPPDPSNRTGELDRIVRFLNEPKMVTFTQWKATCSCGQVCALDKQTTYQWNNWAKHQRTCRLNKLEKENKNSQRELDDWEDEILVDVNVQPMVCFLPYHILTTV